MSTVKCVYVGFSNEVRENWQELVPPPAKPGNWKQDTYEAKLDELREKQAAGMAEHLIGGRVSEAALIWGTDDNVERCSPKALFDKIENSANRERELLVIGFETLEQLRRCAWSEPGSQCYPWAWNAGVPSGTTLVNLWSASGAKQAGISVPELLAHWSVALPTSAATEAIAARTLAWRMGLYQ